VDTTIGGVCGVETIVNGAGIAIIARVEGVDALSGGGIARVDGAQKSIIAVHRIDNALTSGGIARGGKAVV